MITLAFGFKRRAQAHCDNIRVCRMRMGFDVNRNFKHSSDELQAEKPIPETSCQ